jgi:hypothetical protein
MAYLSMEYVDDETLAGAPTFAAGQAATFLNA